MRHMTKPAQIIEITSPQEDRTAGPKAEAPDPLPDFSCLFACLLHDFYLLLFLQQVS